MKGIIAISPEKTAFPSSLKRVFFQGSPRSRSNFNSAENAEVFRLACITRITKQLLLDPNLLLLTNNNTVASNKRLAGKNVSQENPAKVSRQSEMETLSKILRNKAKAITLRMRESKSKRGIIGQKQPFNPITTVTKTSNQAQMRGLFYCFGAPNSDSF